MDSTAVTTSLAGQGKTTLLDRAQRRDAVVELPLRWFLALTALVGFSIFAAIWLYVAAFPMAYLDLNYPLARAKAQLAAQCLPGDIAVFGDSRAVAGIMPKTMDIPVTNLAYPGASPVENYFLVRNLLRCPTPPRLVVLAQSAALYEGPHAFWNIFAHNGILNTAELSQVMASAARLHDTVFFQMPHPGGVPYGLLPALYGMRFPPLYFSSVLNGYGFARGTYNRAVLQDIVANSGNVLFGDAAGSDDVADEARMPNWAVTPVTNQYLLQTLALLRSRHVPVAIMTMPVNQATCAQMPAAVQAGLTRYLNGIQAANQDVVMADPRIACWPDRDYNDNALFKQAGALAYSQVFEAAVKQVLVAVPKAAAHE